MELHYKNYCLETLEGEFWIDVFGYDGIYSVSNLGRFKSELRFREDTGQRINERILKQQVVRSNLNNLLEPSKSLHISLSKNGVRQTHNVSVLVGTAFIGECKEGQCFNKKNKRWDDCRAENLEIKCFSDSVKDSYKVGINLRKKRVLTPRHESKYIWTRLSDGKSFISEDLVDEYGKQVRPNINKGIIKNKKRYGSFWTKAEIVTAK